MAIVLFLAILAVLILSHEFGHFLVAKRAGIRVDEFGFGFPPRLWSWRWGETVYSLNLLPFGGFVKIFGEDSEETALLDPATRARSFSAASRITQAGVLLAGVAANFILAWLLIAVGFSLGLPVSESTLAGERLDNPRLIITAVLDESPAAAAGLVPGDVITRLKAGSEVLDQPAVVATQEFIRTHAAAPLTLSIIRNGVATTTTVQARPETAPTIGVGLDRVGVLIMPWWQALGHGAVFTAELTAATAQSLGGLVWGALHGHSVLGSIVGPVGLAGIVADTSQLGLVYLLSLIAFISINLAVVNLIPFPALDGGRLLFLIIETVKGSPLRPAVTGMVNLIGFGILILLMLLITYSDLVRLWFN